MLSSYYAIKTYKRNLRNAKIYNFFAKVFNKPCVELPLLYSNVPLAVKGGYVPLTKNMVLRNERLAYKSVCYIQEASLFADNKNYKILDTEQLDDILLFGKLFRS